MAFDQLSVEQQDETLKRIESGEIKFEGVDAQDFFDALLKDVPEEFFSDPIQSDFPASGTTSAIGSAATTNAIHTLRSASWEDLIGPLVGPEYFTWPA